MTPIKFIGRISRQGDKRRTIEIPVDLHQTIKSLEGKQLKVTIEEIKL